MPACVDCLHRGVSLAQPGVNFCEHIREFPAVVLPGIMEPGEALAQRLLRLVNQGDHFFRFLRKVIYEIGRGDARAFELLRSARKCVFAARAQFIDRLRKLMLQFTVELLKRTCTADATGRCGHSDFPLPTLRFA